MANRFQHLIDGKDENKKPAASINTSGGNRFSKLLESSPVSSPLPLERRFSQPNTAPIPSVKSFNFLPAHTPYQAPEEPNYQAAWIKGTVGSLPGRVITPLVERLTGKKIDLSTLPEANTLGEKAVGLVGNIGSELPLWMTGDTLLAKPLSMLAKTAPVAKGLSYLPKAITPALETGVRAAATYGLPINALETAVEGDGVQGFTERLKEAPLMGLGGVALHGAGQVIGRGVKSGVDYARFNKATQLPEARVNPLETVQNAYRNQTTIRDARAQQLGETFADTSNNLGRTGQIAPRQGMTPAELLQQKQLDIQGAFGQPRDINKYRFTTGEQRAFQELQDGITEAQNYVRHTDVLAPYPPGTTVEQAYADIKANVGVDLPKLMENWNKTQTLKNKMTPEELRFGRVSGVVPPLKPRDTVLPSQVENQLPAPRLRPTQERMTWTNRELTQNAGPLPIRSITPENLGQLPWRQLESVKSPTPIKQGTVQSGIPNIGNAPLKTPNPMPKDTKQFWASVNKELFSKGEQPPFTLELMKKDIQSGKIDISKLSNEEEVRRMLGMDLQKFSQNAELQRIVGAEPDVPIGMKERGVSENIRTDVNRPDALRDSYSTDPLVYKQLGNKETLAKAQSIFDKGLEPAITELDALIKNMKPEAAPLVKMIADKLTLEGNIARARELMSNAAIKATESGQFGQAFRILRDADPETFLMTFDKQLNKLNKEGLEKYGKKWKNVDLTPDELAMVGNIERGNQASYDSAFEQIQARIANEMPASAFEKINAWRHISMLMNPKTHIRNVGGNAIMMGMRKSAQRVSGVLQKVILPEAKRTQSVFVNKEYKGLAKEYFEANKKDLLSGANKYQEGVSLNMPDKRVFRKSRIGEKLGMDIDVLEKVRKFNYSLLQKGDNPFFQNAYVDRLASYAQAKGERDFAKLGQEAFDTATLEAQQATYKDASVIANFLNKVKHPEKSASLGRKTAAVLTEAALPFTKTPINIIKRGIQYSPIGVANGLFGIKSSKGAAIAIDELAKGLTGTGILGLGYLLASKGILTGKAEKDIDLKAYNSNIGNSPFSILGKYSYDWMQPFSVPLSVGVEIYNAVKDKPEDIAKMNSLIAKNDSSKFDQMALVAVNGIMEGLNASGDTVFNLSIMKGIKTLLGGQQGVMEGLAQLPQGYATQFIPTASNQLAGAIDPLVRQTYVKDNMPESFKNAIISRIPVASTTLQPKQTPFGEDVKKIENPLGRVFSQFLSPGIIAKDQNINPKVDAELRRLNKVEGLTTQFPTMVPNYIEKTQTHPRITLTLDETTQYQKRVGQLTHKSFQKIINSGAYTNARINKAKGKSADEVKADLLANAISDAKALAKKEILKSRGMK